MVPPLEESADPIRVEAGGDYSSQSCDAQTTLANESTTDDNNKMETHRDGAECPPTEQLVDDKELLRLLQDEAMGLPDLDIALAGLAGRLPKSDSINEFEANLRQGSDMLNDNDDARFECGLWGLPKRFGRLKDITKFDCEFFGYKPEAANYMDHQLRIIFEVVYESMLDAGVNPSTLRGSNTGVFLGLHCNEFELELDTVELTAVTSDGYRAQCAVKLAQYFDLKGPVISFDAACASGFVSFHDAIEALRQGVIDQAIVCAVNISVNPTSSVPFAQMQMLSPTGYSRFLDSRADGYVKSEACVSLLLQRKHLARRNYASVMEAMTGADGYKKEGITFPSVHGQEQLVRAAKQSAGISTNHIEFLEAHGTGTPAGDPQEVKAISNVYCTTGSDGHEQRKIGPLLLGSVKTNMGHSEGPSGLCSLAKVAMMLEHEIIYKNLNFDQPNKDIEPLMDGRVKNVAENQRLRAKIIPLSCYGFGGTNVHAILRANERPAIEQQRDQLVSTSGGGTPRLIVMFGRSQSTVAEFFDQMLDQTNDQTRNCLSDDFLALVDELNNVDKIDRLMSYRGYLLVNPTDGTQLVREIKRCDLQPAREAAGDKIDMSRQRCHLQDSLTRKCHLILPGNGSEWTGMAAGLQNFQPFWSTIERLNELLEPYEFDLIKALTSPDESRPNSGTSNSFVATIANVAYQIALTNVFRDQLRLRHLGSIVGHSVGEVSCAYAAGLFDEREAIMVAYHLGKTMDENRHLFGGRMIALALDESEGFKLISEFKETCGAGAASTIDISCINGPQSVTISGVHEEMREFCSYLDRLDIHFRQVNDSLALHNRKLMNQPEIKAKLHEALARVLLPLTDYDRRRTSWLSSFEEELEDASQLNQANANYFVEMLCNRVNFLAALNRLDDDSIVLEVGPSNLFESQLIQFERNRTADEQPLDQNNNNNNERTRKFHYVKTMKRMTPVESQVRQLLVSMGELYQAGATFDLNNFYHGAKGLQFPVRRGTPSLGSLLKWSHEHTLFVPAYPAQFARSSAKGVALVDIVQDRDKYLADHRIEGRILYPATAYLYLMWRTFSHAKLGILDVGNFEAVEDRLVPIEFHHVKLSRATMLGSRETKLSVHFEEATGRFEIKEGGSVAVDGWAFSPTEAPKGLLYEGVRARIEQENLELTLSKDDIYKQFRVNGYDYGEAFRNIECCSRDGRYCRVKFNGYFIALTDSILQSIFLAVNQYATTGGLFLPTKFEYARFQPEPILNKIRQARMDFDKSMKEHLMIKRGIMDTMRREIEGSGADDPAASATDAAEADANPAEEQREEQLECIFETYCDPMTGIIITDGIEMRGIKATPAPRRSDVNEVLLESYQFVCDIEEPVEDEKLTRFEFHLRDYARTCDSMSLELMEKLSSCQSGKDDEHTKSALSLMANGQKRLAEREIDAYKKLHLPCIHAREGDRSIPPKAQGGESDENREKTTSTTTKKDPDPDEYDIGKNAPRSLMSILDQLLAMSSSSLTFKQIGQLVEKNEVHLMNDLIQTPMTSERFMRPIMETVIENICTKKMNLRLVEINLDDELMRAPLQQMARMIEPALTLEYTIAHLGGPTDSSQPRTLKDLSTLIKDNQLRNLDLVVYKDLSCYSLAKPVVERDGSPPVMSPLNGAVKDGGYVLVFMRKRLTLAERILLALREPRLVELSEEDLAATTNGTKSSAMSAVLNKIQRLNSLLEARYKSMLVEAEQNKMLCLARKSDPNGCLVMLFKRTLESSVASAPAKPTNEVKDEPSQVREKQPVSAADRGMGDHLMLRVRHDQLDWLEELKNNFKQQTASDDQQKEEKEQKEQQEPQPEQQQATRLVWLCAVATKQNPVNGLIGMMQALRRELGSHNLRCFHDVFTFKNADEPIYASDIERSSKFKQALARGQIWNCVDSLGRFGSYRHFTINEYMNPKLSLCSANSELEEEPDDRRRVSTCGTNEINGLLEQRRKSSLGASGIDVNQLANGAYVNVATRGDLSSFTWFEAPHKYLSETERQQLVTVAYSALNFRDIMLASGRLPLDTLPIKVALSECPLGLEFSGYDANGRRVMGAVSGRGIATQLVCPELGAIKVEVPDWLDLKEAATIPVAYSTAIMALVYRGQMRRGESILIHAGSGGVGQAAIRLAAYWGLKVFTTVGSAEKRKFLLEEFGDCLTDEQIFNSRDCSFEHRVMRATNGLGVDIVLNSLADDKLQASVRCLRDGGRFLEIGKYDISMDSRLELMQLDTNKTFHGILLDKLYDPDDTTEAFRNQLRGVMDTMQRGIMEGFVRPIKYKLFKRNQVEEAFRFMATGKHMGKVLIEITPEGSAAVNSNVRPAANLRCVPCFQLSPRKSYIVTGGLGGFGLELCKWLAIRGARRLVITSRTGPRNGYQRATLSRLERNNGVKCLIVDEATADATQFDGASKLCQLAMDWAPERKLGGIFHLAMVLKDSLLENMTPDDFRLVCRPKVDACVELDAVSRSLDLDFFVAFSSIACGKGNAGQSNYAYANSCIERVCETRRSIGQHGLAIQWGLVGDVGVAFENLGGNDVTIAGVVPQRMPSCFATLDRLLSSSFSVCLSVLPANRSGDQFGERTNLVEAIMNVLGIKDSSKISEDATLGELGLDSLMAVEIRQYIEREYDTTLNIQEIRALTIAKIREMSEREKPSKQAAPGQRAAKPELREATSYGAQTATAAGKEDKRTVAGDKVNEVASGAEPEVGHAAEAKVSHNLRSLANSKPSSTGELKQKLLPGDNDKLSLMFNKDVASKVLPPLKLPQDDFCRLNGAGQPSAPQPPTSRRPLFFLPSIHGSFEPLESVCENLQRPCIGLNWTHKLAHVDKVSEVVQFYLDLLQRTDWLGEFSSLPTSGWQNNGRVHEEAADERVVDLVGYSFGATIAFEMMLAIHKLQADNQTRPATRGAVRLVPGHLVLLDGSPKQVELGFEYYTNFSREKSLGLTDTIDEMLTGYVMAHSRGKVDNVDYIKLHKQLVGVVEVEEKIELASAMLAQLLADSTGPNGVEAAHKMTTKATPAARRQVEIAYAMEAYFRRYVIIEKYEATGRLPADCTLIRAEEMYLKHEGDAAAKSYNRDMGLSTIVDGQVDVFVMRGDHETFLSNNGRWVGDILTKVCKQ